MLSILFLVLDKQNVMYSDIESEIRQAVYRARCAALFCATVILPELGWLIWDNTHRFILLLR
jgi:hypothetical protein